MQHPLCIVPAPLCAMPYGKYGGHFPGDGAPEAVKLREKRKNGAELEQTKSSSSTTSSGSYMALPARLMRSLKYNGKQLL